MATVPSMDLGRFTRRDGALWFVAAATVVSMHVAVAYAVQSLQTPDEDGGAPPALAIELAPIPMASPIAAQGDIVESEPSELASAADTVETLDEVEPEHVAEAVEPPLAAVEPEDEAVDKVAAETLAAEDTPATDPLAPPEPVQHAALTPVDETVADTTEPERATEAEEAIPDVVEAVTPEVDVPLPAPRPEVVEVAEVKADRKVEAKARKPETETRAAPKKKAQAATKADTPSPKAAAPKRIETVAAPRVSPAKWQSRVLSWLNRHKRYPSSAKSRRQEGLVQVAFTVDQGGRVTSSRVSRSSGVPALDEAALEMVRRASPVPAPPPEIASSALRLAVPVDFSLR
jgi:protein TonB